MGSADLSSFALRIAASRTTNNTWLLLAKWSLQLTCPEGYDKIIVLVQKIKSRPSAIILLHSIKKKSSSPVAMKGMGRLCDALHTRGANTQKNVWYTCVRYRERVYLSPVMYTYFTYRLLCVLWKISSKPLLCGGVKIGEGNASGRARGGREGGCWLNVIRTE